MLAVRMICARTCVALFLQASAAKGSHVSIVPKMQRWVVLRQEEGVLDSNLRRQVPLYKIPSGTGRTASKRGKSQRTMCNLYSMLGQE